MGLFGKIFGGKSESEALASAQAAENAAAGDDLEQTQSAGAGEALGAERVRSLSQRPDNDAAPPSIVIAEELGAIAVVSPTPPEPSRSRSIPRPDARAHMAPGPALPPPTVSAGKRAARAPADSKQAGVAPQLAPSIPSDSSARKASSAVRTPPRQPPALRTTRRERVATAPTPSTAQSTPDAEVCAAEPVSRPDAGASVAAMAKPDRETQLRGLREAHGDLLVHIQQFAFDLDLACAPVRWVAACKPAVAALARAAEQLELADVLGAAQVLGGELTTLEKANDGKMNAEARDSTLRSYAALAQFAGDALRPVPDGRAREQLVLTALLQGLDGVHALTFDKLGEAGALSIGMLAAAAPTALAETTGLEPGLVERIVERVAEAASGHGRATASEVRGLLMGQARQALAALQGSHSRFLQAEAEEDGPGKRVARREREGELLLLEGLFARLGELGAALDLQRGSMPQRIERARALVAQWSE